MEKEEVLATLGFSLEFINEFKRSACDYNNLATANSVKEDFDHDTTTIQIGDLTIFPVTYNNNLSEDTILSI